MEQDKTLEGILCDKFMNLSKIITITDNENAIFEYVGGEGSIRITHSSTDKELFNEYQTLENLNDMIEDLIEFRDLLKYIGKEIK